LICEACQTGRLKSFQRQPRKPSREKEGLGDSEEPGQSTTAVLSASLESSRRGTRGKTGWWGAADVEKKIVRRAGKLRQRRMWTEKKKSRSRAKTYKPIGKEKSHKLQKKKKRSPK